MTWSRGDSFPSWSPPNPNTAGAQVTALREAEVTFQPWAFQVNSFFGQDDKGIYYRKSLARMICASPRDSNKGTFAPSDGLVSLVCERLTFLRETRSALLFGKRSAARTRVRPGDLYL